MNRSAVIVGSAVVVGCVLVGEMVSRHMGSQTTVVDARRTPEATTSVAAREPHVEPAPVPAVKYAPVPEQPAPAAVADTGPADAPPVATAPVRRAARRRPPDVVPGAPEPVVPVEVARVALAYVGTDPEAEAVWYAAINDPSLSDHARQDLIEDLNEDGFADPKNVTPDELPLVVSRLALIEELAPDAMDQVNADAFAEAYKDLANMYVRLTGDNEE